MNAQSRTTTAKQKIVVVAGVTIFGFYLWFSFLNELGKTTPQPQLSLNLLIRVVGHFLAVVPLGIMVILTTLFYRFRIAPDRGTQDDGYELLERATRLERKGCVQEALTAYEDIARRYARTSAGIDAQKSLESLISKAA